MLNLSMRISLSPRCERIAEWIQGEYYVYHSRRVDIEISGHRILFFQKDLLLDFINHIQDFRYELSQWHDLTTEEKELFQRSANDLERRLKDLSHNAERQPKNLS